MDRPVMLLGWGNGMLVPASFSCFFLLFGTRIRGEQIWLSPFQGVCGLCPKLRVQRARSLASEVYPALKLQCHFTCGFDFRHSQ